MGNGQWAMGNGQWAMGNGQWAMGNGQKKSLIKLQNFKEPSWEPNTCNLQLVTRLR
jgi:hypothetical protein